MMIVARIDYFFLRAAKLKLLNNGGDYESIH